MVPNKRMLHSKIWESSQFLELNYVGRLLFIGMISLGDDEGRLRGDGWYLKGHIFSRDRVTPKEIEKLRDQIEKKGLIIVYKRETEIFIQHPNWTKYQTLRKDRFRYSEYPSPPSDIWQPSDNQITTQDRSGEANAVSSEYSAAERSSAVAEPLKQGASIEYWTERAKTLGKRKPTQTI
jgi:hypothetical protein